MKAARSLVIALTSLFVIAGCASGSRVTDFTDRSVAYGWINIGDVDANRLNSVVIYQLQPQTKTPYYNVKVTKFEGGYLYYAFSFPQGAVKLYEISGQRCVLILCSNSTFSYAFGKQGDTGAVRIGEPGVYFLGALELEDVKTGFFEQGKFNVNQAEQPPTQRQMLTAMLKDARELDPLVSSRIESTLNKL